MSNAEKVLVVEKPEIVIRGTIERPYFEIKYKEMGNDKYNVGYGSYFLDKVFRWKEEEFEIVEGKKVEGKKMDENEIRKSLLSIGSLLNQLTEEVIDLAKCFCAEDEDWGEDWGEEDDAHK